MGEYSPMMQHYLDIKKEYNDAIIFYRLGDFYEMFFEDAQIASRELEITLTARDCGKKERAPMCRCSISCSRKLHIKIDRKRI